MTPRLARYLLALTVAALCGFGVGWFARAYTWTPLIVLAVVAAAAYCAGFLVRCQLLADERDEACKLAVEIAEGQRFGSVPVRDDLARQRAMEAHPSRSKLHAVQDGQR